jgi:cytochrome o ubiquinol oxidase subunit 3
MKDHTLQFPVADSKPSNVERAHALGSEHSALSEQAREKDATTFFGFWVYLMTDLVLFASLFSVFAVLRANTFGGPSIADIFNGPFVLIETFTLLASSFTTGLAMLAVRTPNEKKAKDRVIFFLLLTALLGGAFLSMELSEFATLVSAGHSWQQSGFLSSYFVLVGTHGLHILIGIVWVIALMISIAMRGLTRSNLRKLLLFSLFWHFLDLVWIFIFTIVYLLGIV